MEQHVCVTKWQEFIFHVNYVWKCIHKFCKPKKNIYIYLIHHISGCLQCFSLYFKSKFKTQIRVGSEVESNELHLLALL